MNDLAVTYRAIAGLKPRAGNPVLIDSEDGIIAGHGRVEAARLLGLENVPTIRLSDMTEAQVRAYVIADNRLAENAGWDRNLLTVEFSYLSELELDFDLTVTGFALPEIDILIGEFDARVGEDAEVDVVPARAEGPAVTRAGDVWVIGGHRLICGDTLEADNYSRLLGGERAQMVFTDPPYNVPISGHVMGLGKVQHREFAMASGEMSCAEFTGFLRQVCGHLADHSADGALHLPRRLNSACAHATCLTTITR